MYRKHALVILLGLVCALAIGPAPLRSGRGAAAQGGCSIIYGPSGGWAVDLCLTDPSISTPMEIVLDGVSLGQAALVRISHQSQADAGMPQVAVIYAGGYIRLRQNADPVPPIPFGGSFVLGPAYWPAGGSYQHNPQLTRLEIDTTLLPLGPLWMQARGANGDFDVAYELTLPAPRDRQTRLHVTQTYTATADIPIAPARRAEAQGFKLAQVSSMFINEEGACDGGHSDCHDVDAVRFIGSDLQRRQAALAGLTPPTWIVSSPLPLGGTWLDALHTDDASWQGNTPNLRIALDVLPGDRTITPQGWISATTDPNQDNLGLWLHDDGAASQSWTAGQSGQVGYWLLALDDPPEPWADLNLRTGRTFLDFESTYDCSFVHDLGQVVTGTVTPITGYTDTALELLYNLGAADYNWAQIRCDFDPPLDLSAYDHLRLDWRGDPGAANSFEIGLIDQVTTTQRIFARGYHQTTHHGWWGQLAVPFSFLAPWHGGTFDPGHVAGLFISVVKDGAEDEGGIGSLAIDNLNAYNVVSRTVPTDLALQVTHPTAAARAAQWLVTQQQPTGLLKSWAEESICTAHTYDQALALLVWSHAGMWAPADALVGALAEAQNGDGSWFKSHQCDAAGLPCVHCDRWEGDIAWAIYALSRYLALGGDHPLARPALDKGAAWLAARQGADGCLVIDHTEGTIDAWCALQAAGPGYNDEADRLRDCLLAEYWDGTMGRFKGGRDWQQPYLDNQTWGAAFLRAVGRDGDARRALSYADQVFRLPAQGGQLYGLDGQAGPWSVWNEGTAQYVAVGGTGADDLVLELLAQQRRAGPLPGSPDDWSGGGVWTTRWHGVAPAAWFYLALNPGEVCHAAGRVWLPLVIK